MDEAVDVLVPCWLKTQEAAALDFDKNLEPFLGNSPAGDDELKLIPLHELDNKTIEFAQHLVCNVQAIGQNPEGGAR